MDKIKVISCDAYLLVMSKLSNFVTIKSKASAKTEKETN